VDLQKIYKEPRPIFDSSFRVEPSSMAINDWCDKSNEPDIHFPVSFLNFCVWIYNLRISYPTRELYLVDDDVSGAFRHAKYNPNLVALHACLLFGFLFMSTGQTFGDCSSPANFEPIARARQQYAQFLWSQATTLHLARTYLPKLQFQPQPTDPNVFTQSTPDSLNQGVFNSDGSRRPPTFDHHVDDNIYGDVEEFISLGVSASILALYLVLGYPSSRNRDPVSWNKFDGFFTHERKMIGYGVNSRRMVLFMLDHKRTQLLGLLDIWLAMADFDLLQCAELLGHLGSATTTCRWARVLFFGLQNLLRLHLVAQNTTRPAPITSVPAAQLASLGLYRPPSPSVSTPWLPVRWLHFSGGPRHDFLLLPWCAMNCNTCILTCQTVPILGKCLLGIWYHVCPIFAVLVMQASWAVVLLTTHFASGLIVDGMLAFRLALS
jgi:hypothetical protein